MTIDDPKIPEFASWSSYHDFSRSVRAKNQEIRSTEEIAFLETVMATLRERDVTIKKQTAFYRAQIGVVYDDEERRFGYGPKRMKPSVEHSSEGRANPKGTLVLYLATSILTAISEVRPWIGQELSVATFSIMRDLKLLDLTLGHGASAFNFLLGHFVTNTKPNALEKEWAVWIEIDNAFSRPVARNDDVSDYLPTQILTDRFKQNGYDGIVYRSQFGEKGYNVVLFNVEDANVINCRPFRVSKIDFGFEEI